ncbi:dynamin-related protein 3B-like isoform X1 [Phragmites australis]|uniref:dynamin-related protein 3B-like isoform X1 n=1 Tax=Phragmites australis TaxID=29695 RepID=UPI002D769A5C|nr:dynamin-related protein 3B-like isoform X1 [Phragmites australis]
MAKSAAAEAAPPETVGQAVVPLVNSLQDIIARLDGDDAAGLELPQVAAIGGQSSGKSSVLEALVGRDFLPRGPDICTRRPLVLQLVRHSALEEWGEFLHAPGRRFHDFEQIKREIQLETDKEAGDNKGVSEKQIRLKIFSPNVLDITLVDLPGITRVPVGDQPSDIESRIRTMIMQYIKHPSCIILGVSPANADLANSDALQLARLADPDGSRTIGVITKLDIMDRGTDARNFLLGNVIPLKLGYVGVINRSQEDINFNRSVKDALAFEEKFFSSLPAYNGLAHCCGVPQLAKKLNTILLKHITDMLPGLKTRINAQLVAVAKEHAAYGDTVESTLFLQWWREKIECQQINFLVELGFTTFFSQYLSRLWRKSTLARVLLMKISAQPSRILAVQRVLCFCQRCHLRSLCESRYVVCSIQVFSVHNLSMTS